MTCWPGLCECTFIVLLEILLGKVFFVETIHRNYYFNMQIGSG